MTAAAFTLPPITDRPARMGERCTCGRPARTVLVCEGVEIGFCGDRDGRASAVLLHEPTAPTTAGLRAVITTAADVIERVGWTQGQSRSLTGAVCIGGAVAIAADGDEDAELHATFALGQMLPWPSLLEWNDEPERTRGQILAFLRHAARTVTATSLVAS